MESLEYTLPSAYERLSDVYRVEEVNLVEVGKRGDKLRQRKVRYKHKIGIRRHYSRNTVVISNSVPLESSYVKKLPDSEYYY
jgi:hypothetical protein